jgi:hypothetical protein
MELARGSAMACKRKTPDQRLSDRCLAELVILIKDVSPPAHVEISFEQYEDEDAHICVYPPATMQAEEVECLEFMVGEPCNDILLETGLFIVGAVCG